MFLTSATGNLASMILSLSVQKKNQSKYLGVEMSLNFKLNWGPESPLNKSTTTFGLFLFRVRKMSIPVSL